MFNNSNLNHILPIAERLKNEGLFLQVKSETPLATLVAACLPPTKNIPDTDHVGILVAMTNDDSSATDNVPRADHHEELLSKEVADIGRVITAQMATIRNYAAPTVSEIFNLIKDEVNNERPTYWGLDIIRIHPIHNSAVFSGMIEPWASTPPKAEQQPQYMPEQSEEALIELLQTGNNSFDSLLADLIATKPVGWVKDTYMRHFARTGTYMGTADFANLDTAVIVFLLGKALDGNPPADGVAVSLVNYNANMSSMMAQAAIKLHSTYLSWRDSIKSGSLVLTWPASFVASDKEQAIRVHGEVYDEFIKRGGTPELVIGSFISSKVRYVEELLTNKELLSAQYRRYVSVTTNSFNDVLGQRIRELLSKYLHMKIEQLPESHRDYRLTKEQLHPIADQAIDMVILDDLVNDTYLTIRRVVCATLFSHVKANDVLLRMETLTKNDPDLSRIDAAALVVEALIIEYYRSQFVVGKL